MPTQKNTEEIKQTSIIYALKSFFRT